MRLNRQSEIAMAMLAACAERSAEQVTTQQLAVAARTTKDHAAQIVALLVRHGFLASRRGRHGGLTLTETPETIRLGAVLKATQPELAELCDQAEATGRSGNATFDMVVQAAFSSFLTLMDRFTVADLLATPRTRRLGCLECALVNPARRSAALDRAAASRLSGRISHPASLARPRRKSITTPMDSHALSYPS